MNGRKIQIIIKCLKTNENTLAHTNSINCMTQIRFFFLSETSQITTYIPINLYQKQFVCGMCVFQRKNWFCMFNRFRRFPSRSLRCLVFSVYRPFHSFAVCTTMFDEDSNNNNSDDVVYSSNHNGSLCLFDRLNHHERTGLALLSAELKRQTRVHGLAHECDRV